MGMRPSGKRAHRYKVNFKPNSQGYTHGGLAFEQALQRLNFETLMRRGVQTPGRNPRDNLARNRQSKAAEDHAIGDAYGRENMLKEADWLEKALLEMKRELSLAGNPSDEDMRKLWDLEDRYKSANEKKAGFLASHPEGDYLGWS